MSLIVKKHITNGVTWIAIEEADLYICCGCPADTVKHLKKAGVINSVKHEGHAYEDGPNAILLSDTLIQNGQIANLAEFPILHMLYLQGFNLPDHPNYKKSNPILIGYEDQIVAQMEYASVGNHGLSNIDEIMEAGISHEKAEKIIAIKLHFSGGEIQHLEEMISSCSVEEGEVEIKSNVFIRRTGINIFKISYKGESVSVDLNLPPNEQYLAPYTLPFRSINSDVFSITHSGEGNGWDMNRPCMASVIHHQDRVYLIDAGPNILNNLSYLGIGLSEIDGIFLSHIHDDHFAGITELLNVERKLNLYATKLVIKTAKKKLRALMNSELDLINLAFNYIDLEFNVWNNVNGMEVQPCYSPHTVETSIFNFRVIDGTEYRTYVHLADTINFDEYKAIIKKSPDIFSKKDFSELEDSYLKKVNLKKIDVGGGLIHGHISDYALDNSDVLVIAHNSAPVTANKDNLINVSFGDTHTLICQKNFNLLRIKSRKYIKQYFNTLEDKHIELLANQKIKRFEPNQIICSEKDGQKKLLLILSGLVSYENASEIRQTIDPGNFIGFSKRYFKYDFPNNYKAWSYVYGLELDETFIMRFNEKFNLVNVFDERLNLVKILRASSLIHDSISNALFNQISKHSALIEIDKNNLLDDELQNNIFILISGNVKIRFTKGYHLNISAQEHFGGTSLLRAYRRKQNYIFTGKVKALSIPVEWIEKVPKLLWRLIELEEMRYQLSFFNI